MLDTFRWVALTAAIVLVVAVGGIIVSSKQSFDPTQQQAAAENNGEHQKEKENKTLWDRWFPDSISLYTLFLVVFTGVLAVGGVWQLKLLTRAEYTSSQSADAAKKSAEVAERALIAGQRAFLFVSTYDSSVLNDRFQIFPKWENSGVTPANPVVYYTNWKTFEGEPPVGYDYPDLGANGEPLPEKIGGIPNYVGPKNFKFATGVKIPLHYIEVVRTGKLRLFVWGWAKYSDTFMNTHLTQFCIEVVVTGVAQEGDKTTVAISYSDYGPYNKAN